MPRSGASSRAVADMAEGAEEVMPTGDSEYVVGSRAPTDPAGIYSTYDLNDLRIQVSLSRRSAIRIFPLLFAKLTHPLFNLKIKNLGAAHSAPT
jgi:hypothetical protein